MRRMCSPWRAAQVDRAARPFGVTLTWQKYRDLAFKPDPSPWLFTPDRSFGDTPAEHFVKVCVFATTDGQCELSPQPDRHECSGLGEGRTCVPASTPVGVGYDAGDASNRNADVPNLNDPVQNARVGHDALIGFDDDGPRGLGPCVPVGGQRKWLEVGIHWFQRVPSKGVCLGALAGRKAAYGQTQDIHAPRVCVGAERALIPTVRIAVSSRRSGNCCQPCSTFGGDPLEHRAHELRIWKRQEQVGVASYCHWGSPLPGRCRRVRGYTCWS